jgi:hypothetical protein
MNTISLYKNGKKIKTFSMMRVLSLSIMGVLSNWKIGRKTDIKFNNKLLVKAYYNLKVILLI